MQDTEVGESKWELSVSSLLVTKHETMAWAVHGLHAESLVLNFEDKDVVLVVEVMARGLPQLEVEDVGRHDFLVASDAILLLDQVDEVVIDPGSLWIHESTAWRKLVHIEQVLLSADVSVVSLGSFFLEVDPLVHLLLGGESDSVHSLKTIVFGFTEPVGAGVLGDLEGFDNLGRRDMRSCAQIDEVSASVGSDFTTIRDLGGNQLNLEWIVSE